MLKKRDKGKSKRGGRKGSTFTWIKDDFHLVKQKHVYIAPESSPARVILNPCDLCSLSVTIGGAKWG